MRDERYDQNAGYQDGYYEPGYDPAYGQDAGYASGAQQQGFTRHRSSNARQMAATNPVADIARRVGGAVSGAASGLVSNIKSAAGNARRGASAQQAARGERPERAERGASLRSEGEDYRGVGAPCRVCGNPVDSAQSRCPHCGAFVRPLYTNVVFWIAVGALALIIALLSIGITSCSSTGADGTSPSAQSQDPRTALQSVVTTAQSTLDAQSADRTYTRYSLSALSDAVTNANTVLSDANATDDQMSQATQAISTATLGLTALATDYQWPTYSDLTSNTSSYIGQQVAVTGTCLFVNDWGDGSLSTALGSADTGETIVYADYTLAQVNGTLAQGSSFNVYGVLTGLSSDGVPVIYVDTIDVLS